MVQRPCIFSVSCSNVFYEVKQVLTYSISFCRCYLFFEHCFCLSLFVLVTTTTDKLPLLLLLMCL